MKSIDGQSLVLFPAAIAFGLLASSIANGSPLAAVFTETVIGRTLPAGSVGSCPSEPPGTITLSFPFSSSFDCSGSFNGIQQQSVAMALTTGGRKPAADIQIHSLNGNASASAEVDYSFSVQRTNLLAPMSAVPVDFVADMQADVSVSDPSRAVGLARAVIEGDAFGGEVDACNGEGQPCQSGLSLQTLSINTQQMLPPDGFTYDVVLKVTAFGVAAGPDDGSPPGVTDAQAIIDPIIMIDPAFPLRDSYQVLFSPNLIDVPEPGTLVFLVCGLLMFGTIQKCVSVS